MVKVVLSMGSRWARGGLWRVAVIAACLVMVLSTLGTVAFAVPDGKDAVSSGRPEYVPGELLVKFKDTAPEEKVRDALGSLKGEEIGDLKASGMGHWKLDKDADLDKAIRKLEKDCGDDLEFAEPNYYRYADADWDGGPSDAYRGDLWGLHNVGQTGGSVDADIDAMEAWLGGYTGDPSVVVGCIDSGIDYDHEDLVGNIWENLGEIGPDDSGDEKMTNGIDDDGNGFVDDWRGWDFVNNDNDPMDDNGHGTHTAGTIGAVGDNGIGVAGVCWDVQLMPLKFLNSGGSGTSANMIKAVNYAAWFKDGDGNALVRVTCNSYGGGKGRGEESAIKASGALYVCAAGNSGSNSLFYPAGYAADNIISVAATDQDDALASWSNYGSTWVDLGAPGVGILSTVPSDGYAVYDGTSMATPHVAGVAALLIAHTDKTNADVKSQILSTVDDLSSLSGKTVTGGRLNARAALGIATEIGGDTTAPGAVSAFGAGTPTLHAIPLSWTPTLDDGTEGGAAYAYDLRYVEGQDFATSGWSSATRVAMEPVPTASGTQGYTLTGLRWNTYFTARILVFDEAGNYGAFSDPVTAQTASPGYSYTVTDAIDPDTSTFYTSMVLDGSGDPGFGYSDQGNDAVKYAHWNGESWTTQKVASGRNMNTGVSLAYDGNDDPSMTFGWGKLYFAHYSSGTSAWSTVVVDSGSAYNDVTCLKYDSSGNPCVSYRTTDKSGGLKYATKVSGAWKITVVDKLAGARYTDLAFDPTTGYPAIVYSDDPDGDNWLNAVNYAWFDGSAWKYENIETGAVGLGVHATLAFDRDGVPTVVYHVPDPSTIYDVVYRQRIDDVWTEAETIESVKYSGGYELEFSSGNVPYVAYTGGGELKIAHDTSTGWALEIVETSGAGSPMLVLDSSDNPCLGYVMSGILHYATRD